MKTITLKEGKNSSFYLGLYSLAFEYHPNSYFDDRIMIHIKLLFFQWFIHIPVHNGVNECEYPSYGFYFHYKQLVLKWGRKNKHIDLPWSWEWVRTSTLLKGGAYFHETPKSRISWNLSKKSEGEYGTYEWLKSNTLQEEYDYSYTLKSGKVQQRKATIGIVEREWRWKWFMWLPLIKNIDRCIEVEFNEEVGERTGSWKGGTVGCSYKMKRNETILECLRRMEKERVFN